MNEIPSSARDLAVLALRDRAGNTSAHLERLLGKVSLNVPDRGLARELALGTVRRQGALRAVVRAFLARPDRRLPAPLEEILEVALYQIIFLQKVPAFAAVDEAVRQAIGHRHRRQSGLVNGLLRNVIREMSELLAGTPPLARDVLPIAPDAYKKLDRPVFADPAAQPAEYLAEAFSLPLPLADRWLIRLGSLKDAVGLAMHANVRAPIILRVNRLRASVEEVLSSMSAAGVEARRHANGISVVVPSGTDVATLEVFAKGCVQPQDPSASAVVLAAGPRPETKVLDFCAAPGTKTTHLAELMDNRGSIAAVDVSAVKTSKIDANCQRMGISIVTTCLADQVGGLQPGSFDLALVDAPCSNTGVLARRAEARWRFDPSALPDLVRDQRTLAVMASQFVRPGGRLVYSVCSIEPEECSEAAGQILRHRPGLKLLEERQIMPAGADDPTRWYDGGYCAVFEVH